MVEYLLLRFMIVFVRILPFRIMYAFSDLIYFLIFHLIGYRRSVVASNIRNSFPLKNDQEVNRIVKKFYHHLCDITLESLKGFSMSPEDIIRRHQILNPEIAECYFNKGQSVIAVPAHYNNWEWGSLSPGLQIKHAIIAFYKPMSNKQVDAFSKRHRAKFNTTLASIKETALTFCVLPEKPVAYVMASDQSPTNLKDCYWFNFLGQDTAWLHGPEKYARKYNLPVMYVDIRKVNRGFYELKLEVLTEIPESMPDGEITRLYAERLEKSILEEPAFWLWSHKRWKHKRV